MNATVYVGDALAVLRTLPEAAVHCCVSSPPYWNLRSYLPDDHPDKAREIGLEPAVDDWLVKLVAVFAEVHRVLSDDGTFWLNVGDAYATSGGGSNGDHSGLRRYRETGRTRAKTDLARKQRMFLPHRLVLALQEAGWWVRDEIVWHKRAPMPESCRDRCTKAHEFVFLLTKRPSYFFDQEAIREPVSGEAHPRRGDNRTPRGWDTGPGAHRERRGRYEPKSERSAALGRGAGFRAPKSQNAGDAFGELITRRNRRSVWTLSSEPFRDAHFATFPTALVEPCILAGTSAGGACPTCGAPRRRIVRKGAVDLAHQRACGGDANGEYRGRPTKDFAGARAEDASAVKARILAGMRERVTVGWASTCKPTCLGGEPVPCVVLDPFAGSGTTGVVAKRHGHDFIGVELSAEYAAMARRRIHAVAPLWTTPRLAAGGGA